MLRERCAPSWLRLSGAGDFASCMAGAVLVAMLLLLSASNAAAQSTTVEFNIPAQPISSALRAYAHQARVELLIMTEGLNTIQANEVVGRLDPRTALQMLLAGTGLQAEYRPDATVAVGRGSETEGPLSSVGGDAREGQANWFARAGQEVDEAVMMAQSVLDEDQTIRSAETDSGKDQYKRPLEEIIVTGTNIRGIAPESSPVRVFNRGDIQISGAATSQDFIQTLPQNFGGGSNISVLEGGLPNDDSTRFNDPFQGGAGGASVNLHGLGSGATLVLLNGHRMAPSSGIGDFVDISMIPASALERVEVLTDGASSIYGGDAVAGVVNFILRDDFDGAEASLRYGAVTEGDLGQYRANMTGGKDWDTGNALLVYEYFSQDDLSAGDRSFSQAALLPSDLLPDQKRHSALASVSQEVMPDLELFADLIFAERKTTSDFTSVLGISSLAISDSDSSNISAGVSWQFHDDWVIDTIGSYSDARTETDWEAMTDLVSRTVHSKLWTVDTKVSGAVLELPGGQLKLAFGGHYRSEAFSNALLVGTGTERNADRDVYALFGEAYIPIVGPGNAKPGIARLEINASGRLADCSDFGSTANPKVGILWSLFEGLNLRSSYSTSFDPPPLGRVGASDLSVLVYPSLLFNTLLGQTPGDPSIADVDILSISGTSKDLEAEKSRALTVGVDFDHQWRNHRFSANATYFDIKFDGRLGDTPVPNGSTLFNVPNIAFNEPELFPKGTVIFFPTLEQINDVLDSADLPINSPFGSDPLNASVIHFTNVVRNLSLTLVRGIDFDATYTLESVSGKGALLLGLDGTYLMDFDQQAAPTTPIVEQLNTQFHPLDLTLRGRVGYANNGLSADLFLNYKPGYRVDNTPGGMRIESWATVDLSLSYDTQQRHGESVFSDMLFRLSVTNLLNDDPPSVPSNISFNVFGYDPTNASPLGRFVAFELTKGF